MGLYCSILRLTCIFHPRRATERHHHPYQQLSGREAQLYWPARNLVRPQRELQHGCSNRASQKRCPAPGRAPGPGHASSPVGDPQATTELCQGPNRAWPGGGAGSGQGAGLKPGSRASVRVPGPPCARESCPPPHPCPFHRCHNTAMAEQVLAVLPLPQLRARLQEERYRQPRGGTAAWGGGPGLGAAARGCRGGGAWAVTGVGQGLRLGRGTGMGPPPATQCPFLKGSCPMLHWSLGSGFLSRGRSGGLFCILVQGGETFSPHLGVLFYLELASFGSAFAHWPHAVTLYLARCTSLRAGSHPDPIILQSCHRFAES